MRNRTATCRLVGKVLIASLLAFALYNVVLRFYPLQKEVIYSNKERAEEFIYSNQRYSVVFVGSGLIGDFSPASVGRHDYFNLFMPYSGGCTGVQIVALSGKIPDTLFVETNYLYKGFDHELIRQVFRPGLYQARFLLPALQAKHQPVALLKEHLKSAQRRKLKMARYPEPAYSQSVEKFRKDFMQLPDSLKLYHDMIYLEYYFKQLASQGCTVILFEMPVDQQLTNYPTIKTVRRAIRHTLASRAVKAIPPDTVGLYATDDGVHLLEKSVYQYLEYFNRSIPHAASTATAPALSRR